MPVVKVLSPVGVEYVFSAITLFIGAGSLLGILLSLVNGGTDFSILAFPTAALVVCVPVFAALFLRLKKMEFNMPQLRLDPSKRRTTQFLQFVSFTVCLFALIGFLTAMFAHIGSSGGPSIGKAALDALCVIVVFGGILTYYWFDEHKVR